MDDTSLPQTALQTCPREGDIEELSDVLAHMKASEVDIDDIDEISDILTRKNEGAKNSDMAMIKLEVPVDQATDDSKVRLGQKMFLGDALTAWLEESMRAERLQVNQVLQRRHSQLLAEWRSRIISQAESAIPADIIKHPSAVIARHKHRHKHKHKHNTKTSQDTTSNDVLTAERPPSKDEEGNSPGSQDLEGASTTFPESMTTAHVVKHIKRHGSRPQQARASYEKMFEKKVDDSFLHPLRRLCSSAQFEVFFSVLIVTSSFVMALQIQYEGFQMGHEEDFPYCDASAAQRWPHIDKVLSVVTFIFGILFVLEVFLKILGQRIDFVKSIWNWFDTVMAITWILYEGGAVTLINPSILRLLRIARLFRMVRLARTFSAFDVMQLIVGSIQASGMVMLWSLVCLLFLTMTAAMLMHSMLMDYIKADDSRKKYEVYQLFGTFTRSMFTTWEITLGNWVPTGRLLMDNVSEWYALFFLLWRGIVSFAIITTIRGVFLHETFKAAEADEDIMIMQKKRTLKKTKDYMMAFFCEADTSGDGFISLDEFRKLAEDPRMKAWMSAMDMDVTNAEQVFTLMDDGDGQVSVDELLNGVSRLRGTAKSVDVCQLARKISRIENCVIEIPHLIMEANMVATSR